MNNKNFNILVLDDHPINSDAYINLINGGERKLDIKFHKTVDCYSAFNIIIQLEKTTTPLDVALVDLSVPGYLDQKLLSGTDIGLLIRKKFPECIIIILTMHSEPLVLFNAQKQIDPEGFISKNDIDFETFPTIFNDIINLQTYYSSSISSAIKSLLRQTIKWDDFDIQIVLLLDKGFQTKELPQYINLSLSSIEKRKAILKRQLLDKKSSDKELIKKCKVLKLI